MSTDPRRKLVKTMVGSQMMVALAMLAVMATMSYRYSRMTLATVNKLIMENMIQQGRTLVLYQSMEMRDLLADQAFEDAARLVERTVAGDDKLLYGLLLDGEHKALAFAQARGAGKLVDDWHQLGVGKKEEATRLVEPERKEVAGRGALQFTMQVVDESRCGGRWRRQRRLRGARW
jgi:hypothetical protein